MIGGHVRTDLTCMEHLGLCCLHESPGPQGEVEERRGRAIRGGGSHWIPLGAGAHVVRLSGRAFEVMSAGVQRRRPCDLYHSALKILVPDGSLVIEMTPIPDAQGTRRRGRRGRGWNETCRTFPTFPLRDPTMARRRYSRRNRSGFEPDPRGERPQASVTYLRSGAFGAGSGLGPRRPTNWRHVELKLGDLVAVRPRWHRHGPDPAPISRSGTRLACRSCHRSPRRIACRRSVELAVSGRIACRRMEAAGGLLASPRRSRAVGPSAGGSLVPVTRESFGVGRPLENEEGGVMAHVHDLVEDCIPDADPVQEASPDLAIPPRCAARDASHRSGGISFRCSSRWGWGCSSLASSSFRSWD